MAPRLSFMDDYTTPFLAGMVAYYRGAKLGIAICTGIYAPIIFLNSPIFIACIVTLPLVLSCLILFYLEKTTTRYLVTNREVPIPWSKR